MVCNILYFPDVQRGGIEQNLIAYYNMIKGWSDCEVIVLSLKDKLPEEFGHLDVRSINSFKAIKHVHYNIICFQNSRKCLKFIKYLQAEGVSVSAYMRLNNSLFNFVYERSVKRFVAEVYKFITYRKFDGLIANSAELKKMYRFHNKNITVVRNVKSFEVKKNKNNFCFNDKNIKIIFVGRFVHQKNILNLLEGFRHYVEVTNHRNLNLDLYGDGALRNSVQKFSDVVNIFGWQQEIPYNEYDAVVLLSKYEGSPNSLIEAIGNGLFPIISNFRCGGSELVEMCGSGRILPDTKVETISKMFQDLSSNTLITPTPKDRLRNVWRLHSEEVNSKKLLKFLGP